MMTREPAPERRALRPPRSPAPPLSPATAPVLAQIPRGAAEGLVISILVGMTSFSLLLSLYGWWTGDFPGALIVPGPVRLGLLAGLIAAPLPLPLHHWLRRRLMSHCGAPPRVVKRWGRQRVYSEQPLRRGQALLCLLGPPAMITLLGLGGMALVGMSEAGVAMVLVAFEWAAATADASLALRLLREPGCTGLQLRPDGVVLYGTSRAPAGSASLGLWLSSLILIAGWLLLVPFLVFGRWGGGLTLVGVLGISAFAATIQVRGRRRQAVKEQHRRLEKEADEARQMQLSLLPAAPPVSAGVQLAALFEAAHEVSGDFYLFPSAPPGVLRLVIGDVAGKGVPAALTAALAVGLLRGGAEAAAGPATLLQAAGQSLRAARRGRTMVAACAVELDAARCLRWCNAGLPPAALRRAGEVTWLSGGGIPLGSMAQATYQGHETRLLPGDLLLLYTDGLVEATSPLGDLFGRERLAAALGRAPVGCSAAAVLACVQAEVARFIGASEPYDDITAVALRVMTG